MKNEINLEQIYDSISIVRNDENLSKLIDLFSCVDNIGLDAKLNGVKTGYLIWLSDKESLILEKFYPLDELSQYDKRSGLHSLFFKKQLDKALSLGFADKRFIINEAHDNAMSFYESFGISIFDYQSGKYTLNKVYKK